MLVSIITTVYNRKKELIRLFRSLENQTDKEFEWIVVDDKSTDGTVETLKTLEKKKSSFKIRTVFKDKNEGKHIALNYAFDRVNGDVVIIIDSDDVALPNMVEKTKKAWKKDDRLYDDNLAEITFERERKNGKPLRKIPDLEKKMNISTYRRINQLTGDFAETFKAKILLYYRFPKFENEKFLSEQYIWADLNEKYDGIFLDSPLYIAEYQNDGLTLNSQLIQWNNPIGTLEVCKKMLPLEIKSTLDLKSLVKYIVYSFRNRVSIFEMIRNSNTRLSCVIMMIPSFFVYKSMERKLRRKKC